MTNQQQPPTAPERLKLIRWRAEIDGYRKWTLSDGDTSLALVQARADVMELLSLLPQLSRSEPVATPETPCKWCAEGDTPKLLDNDGTRISISGEPGTLCHAYDDSWWPCLRYGVELHTTPAVSSSERRCGESVLRSLCAEHPHVRFVEGVLGGVQPLIEGHRVGISHLLSQMAIGMSIAEYQETWNFTNDVIKDAFGYAQDVIDAFIDREREDNAAAGAGEGERREMPMLPYVCDTCHTQQYASGLCANCGRQRLRLQFNRRHSDRCGFADGHAGECDPAVPLAEGEPHEHDWYNDGDVLGCYGCTTTKPAAPTTAPVVEAQDSITERKCVLELIERFQREPKRSQRTVNALEWLRRQIVEGNHAYHAFEIATQGFGEDDQCARCGLPPYALMHLLADKPSTATPDNPQAAIAAREIVTAWLWHTSEGDQQRARIDIERRLKSVFALAEPDGK